MAPGSGGAANTVDVLPARRATRTLAVNFILLPQILIRSDLERRTLRTSLTIQGWGHLRVAHSSYSSFWVSWCYLWHNSTDPLWECRKVRRWNSTRLPTFARFSSGDATPVTQIIRAWFGTTRSRQPIGW